jgi:hypothetical protein
MAQITITITIKNILIEKLQEEQYNKQVNPKGSIEDINGG